MTLDEAIKHCNEVACKHNECAMEHKQLAQWLTELKGYKEQKPAEWSKNRSKELSLSLQIQAYLNTASDELYAKGKPLYSEERLEDVHKCMLMWQKLHNAYFYQKSSEWSEEDENMIQALDACIDAAIKSGMNYISFGSKSILIGKVKNWIKTRKED